MTHTRKLKIVFVDDDNSEIETFIRLYGKRFEVIPIEATDVNDGVTKVCHALSNSHPDLFVLDLYFPGSDSPMGFDHLSPRELKKLTSGIDETHQILDSLRNIVQESPDDGKILLKKAHSVVQRSRVMLKEWCYELGQGPEEGFKLLTALQKRYPKVPAVFYSRKATLEDAKEALTAGAMDVISKPDPFLESSQATKIARDFENHARGKKAKWLQAVLEQIKKVRIGGTYSPVDGTIAVGTELEMKDD